MKYTANGSLVKFDTRAFNFPCRTANNVLHVINCNNMQTGMEEENRSEDKGDIFVGLDKRRYDVFVQLASHVLLFIINPALVFDS